tara:strand:- start:205 stop:612 length:408 start_codon:yes stop_codon:yes gene_type:complete
MHESDQIIKKLKMEPHPEGGHYLESYRDENVSLIYYLLKKNEKSHWHRLSKNEILHFYKGHPLSVDISLDGKTLDNKVLGNKVNSKENMHIIIKAGSWFSMTSTGDYSLIGCTVSPAFDYSDFELAPKGWSPMNN